jgi:DNA-binding transcriptional LysR family regulator
MERNRLNDLVAFKVVAEEGSFTRAAAKLGMSQSALSHAMGVLEHRLGVRLLARTTRSVAPTEAGQRLLRMLRPALADIEAGLASLSELRDKPSGSLRISVPKPASTFLMEALSQFLPAYPDVKVELVSDESFTDIVAGQCDAGVRLGESIDQDMIAVRISPDIRMAIVGSPQYFADHPKPKTPQDLSAHRCINYREGRGGGLYAWEFERRGRALSVRVEGNFVANDSDLTLAAALKGLGLAPVFEYQAAEHIAAGRLLRVLDDWCPSFPGFHLYYPSRRQTTPALAALVEALRYRK